VPEEETDVMAVTEANDMPTAQIDLVREYQAARDRYAELSEQRTEASKRVDELQAKVLDLYQKTGVTGVRLDGRLVYVIRKLWARPIAGREPELVAALGETGHGELIERRVGAQRLSAWVRECDRDETPIPPEVSEVLEVSEVFSLGLKKG
jgi:hypothetical protein